MIEELLPLRTLIERAERGDTTPAEYFVMQLECKAARGSRLAGLETRSRLSSSA